jgi:hypothetical protein
MVARKGLRNLLKSLLLWGYTPRGYTPKLLDSLCLR